MTAPFGRLGTVASLHVYPVKSLGGVRVDAATVTDLGLARDRRWLLVDDDGVFLTQRTLPRMARVHATPHLDGTITLDTLGQSPLSVAPPSDSVTRRSVRIWEDTVEAQTYSVDVDAWCSDAIGARCHLVYMPDDVRRPVDPTYAGPDDRAAFSDAFPILVVSEASLADLNARLAARGVAPVVIERFRPNVVVADTAGPFAEDAWRDFAAGDVRLRVVKPCARCVLTTVDPATAEVSPRGEPLRTLATYRTRGNKVLFAQNALVVRGGTLRVGDAVTIPA